MPELPEVETIRRQLLKALKGKTITSATLTDHYRNYDPTLKTKALAKIVDVRRRAKLLLIDLSNGNSLAVHLKMTGSFHYQPKDKDQTHHYTRIAFRLSDGGTLLFNDVRKFGYAKIIKTQDVEEWLKKSYNPGPDPLQKGFTFETFSTLLKKRPRGKIKTVLLDQKLIGGVGNIYAQEACWHARVDPRRTISTLTDKELHALYDALQDVLTRAIAVGGTSADRYVDIYGNEGGFVPHLKVYDKTTCPRCKNKLSKTWMAGRGTSFCGKCQK